MINAINIGIKKINTILMDTWNKVEVNKDKYINYVNAFKY